MHRPTEGEALKEISEIMMWMDEELQIHGTNSILTIFGHGHGTIRGILTLLGYEIYEKGWEEKRG